MTAKELLNVYCQKMREIQIKNGFSDNQMISYRKGYIDAIHDYEQRIDTDSQKKDNG